MQVLIPFPGYQIIYKTFQVEDLHATRLQRKISGKLAFETVRVLIHCTSLLYCFEIGNEAFAKFCSSSLHMSGKHTEYNYLKVFYDTVVEFVQCQVIILHPMKTYQSRNIPIL